MTPFVNGRGPHCWQNFGPLLAAKGAKGIRNYHLRFVKTPYIQLETKYDKAKPHFPGHEMIHGKFLVHHVFEQHTAKKEDTKQKVRWLSTCCCKWWSKEYKSMYDLVPLNVYLNLNTVFKKIHDSCTCLLQLFGVKLDNFLESGKSPWCKKNSMRPIICTPKPIFFGLLGRSQAFTAKSAFDLVYSCEQNLRMKQPLKLPGAAEVPGGAWLVGWLVQIQMDAFSLGAQSFHGFLGKMGQKHSC